MWVNTSATGGGGGQEAVMDRRGEPEKKRCSEGRLPRHQRGNRDMNPLELLISVITHQSNNIMTW